VSYPGTKTAAGVAERIISQMPVHDTYVELFAGHAAIYRKKSLARRSLLIDVDDEVTRWLAKHVAEHPQKRRSTKIRKADALQLLATRLVGFRRCLVYVDPPYLGSTRAGRRHYRCEFDAPAQHRRLLRALCGLKCYVMISGYPSKLYDELLKGWRCIRYTTMTRGGPRIECLWMNFPEGLELHDTRFVGRGFRERERIKRKRERWVKRLVAMPAAERQVIREALAAATAAMSDA
jgi:site-specific DNA-adenine methylase